MGRYVHLARRAARSLSNAQPDDAAVESARAILLPAEMELWSGMDGRDKRHSLEVLARFRRSVPDATRAEEAAALLHDVGKARAPLGWCARVWTTAFVPLTARMRRYRDHERIGVDLLTGVSDERTIALLSRTADDATAEALWRADDL